MFVIQFKDGRFLKHGHTLNFGKILKNPAKYPHYSEEYLNRLRYYNECSLTFMLNEARTFNKLQSARCAGNRGHLEFDVVEVEIVTTIKVK